MPSGATVTFVARSGVWPAIGSNHRSPSRKNDTVDPLGDTANSDRSPMLASSVLRAPVVSVMRQSESCCTNTIALPSGVHTNSPTRPVLVAGSRRRGAAPPRSTSHNERAGCAASLQRKATTFESGDQRGDAGAAPASGGPAVIRSMVSGVRAGVPCAASRLGATATRHATRRATRVRAKECMARTYRLHRKKRGAIRVDRPLPLPREDRQLPNLLPPFARPGLVHVAARRIDRHRDRHVLHLKLVDRFHAELLERHHP